MSKSVEQRLEKVRDGIQDRLARYACGMHYDDLPPEAIHAAKVRVIDTLGALVGGFFGEPCRIVRDLGAGMPDPEGATIIGTRIKTTPDMAAFVNATTARFPEMIDSYHRPGSFGGHPADAVMSILAAGEHAQTSGRAYITSVVLAYEVYCRFSDIFHNKGFDNTNFICLATAIAAGKLFELSQEQMAHCISMAVVPNVMLRQVRMGQLSMFKGVSAGQAGRAGVFSAMLARAGMEGPHLPFVGKAGWCDHVARERFSLDTLGGHCTPFKILESQIKIRPAAGQTIPSILAAEKISPVNISDVKQVIVECYKRAIQHGADPAEHPWDPESREGADHSIPYVVATTLMDGTISLRSFNDAHLWNPDLRALMQKIEVVENDEFTRAFDGKPQAHRTRVTVITNRGNRLIGEAGGGQDDMAAPKSAAQIDQKFRGLTEVYLGSSAVNSILERLWNLEDFKNIAEIPPAFALD